MHDLASHRRSEVAEHRGAPFPGLSEVPRRVDRSPVDFLPGTGRLQLALFEVAEDGVIGDVEHDVVGFDVWV